MARPFVKAGEVAAFQQIQQQFAFREYMVYALKLARKYNLRSARGIAVALDRSIQQGYGGASALFASAARELSGDPGSFWPSTELSFLERVGELSVRSARGAPKRVDDIIHGQYANELPVANFDTETYFPATQLAKSAWWRIV